MFLISKNGSAVGILVFGLGPLVFGLNPELCRTNPKDFPYIIFHLTFTALVVLEMTKDN